MSATAVKPEADEIRRALDVLFKPEDVIELRAIFSRGRKRTDAGYFDGKHREELVRAAMRLNSEGAAVYVVMNRIDPQLLGRYANRIERYASATATDANVLRRRWLLLDFDPVRPKETSATDAQIEAAKQRATSVYKALRQAGWPDPATARSGNGFHALYPVDLPNDEASRDLIKGALEGLSSRFSDQAVKIDVAVFNAARIVKLYGTVACKGDSTELTPWRLSSIVFAPERTTTVTEDQLRAAAPKREAPRASPANRTRVPRFDLEDFLARLGIEYVADTHEGSERFKLAHCPFNPEHRRGEAAIFRKPSGALGFKCQHESCSERRWQDVRELIDGPQKRRTTQRDPGVGPQTRAQPQGADLPEITDTDIANADRLVAQHGDDVAYVPEWGWSVWTGKYWARDELRVRGLMKGVARSINAEAAHARDISEQRRITQWARSSQNAKRLVAALYCAQDEVAARTADFDQQHWLLPCENGTIDLRTGELRPHRREDRATLISPVPYDPNVPCPTWDAFLERVLPDGAVRAFVRRFAGYSLTGVTHEQVLAFLYGTGRNGKSVFLEALAGIMGDYHVATRIDTFQLRDRGGIPNDIAALAGARLVSVSETSEGVRLNESLVKDLTGGDTIAARFLHREFFQFRPSFKLWVRGNHKPQIRGTDDGIWRRLLLIPFTVQIPEAEVDPKLPEKLREELPGILAWAVRGCLEWQRDGLKPPTAVREAVTEYREEMDILGEFVGECCVAGDGCKDGATPLYKAYRQWCEDNGYRPVNHKNFGLALGERGYQRRRGHGGAIVWHGIELLRAGERLTDVNRSTTSRQSRAHDGEKEGKPSPSVHRSPPPLGLNARDTSSAEAPTVPRDAEGEDRERFTL